MVRLKDIAEELNITINSVSRALRGMKGTSPELQQKVQETAKRMKYVPNISAQSLRTNSTKILAIVFDNFLNPHYYIMMYLLSTKLQKYKYNLVYFSARESVIIKEKTILDIASRNVDGIISFLDVDTEAEELLKSLKLPIFIFGRTPKSEDISYFSCDDEMGGYIAAKYLLDLGHKKIAFLGRIENLKISDDRLSGYIRALEECRFKVDSELIITRSKELNNGGLMIEELFRRKKDFTAVFCFNDYTANDAATKLISMGYTVPKDISVIGYDNVNSHIPNPLPLTSIGYNKEEQVESFVNKIINKLKGGEEDRFTQIVSPTLFLGSTTIKNNQA